MQVGRRRPIRDVPASKLMAGRGSCPRQNIDRRHAATRSRILRRSKTDRIFPEHQGLAGIAQMYSTCLQACLRFLCSMPASMNAGAALSRHHEISTMTHPRAPAARVHALRRIAETIIELDLRGEGGSPAPIEAGAHLDLHRRGLTRSYSLTNPGDASGRYAGGGAGCRQPGRLGLHPCPAPPRRHAAGQRSAQPFPLAARPPASSSPAASASRRSGP